MRGGPGEVVEADEVVVPGLEGREAVTAGGPAQDLGVLRAVTRIGAGLDAEGDDLVGGEAGGVEGVSGRVRRHVGDELEDVVGEVRGAEHHWIICVMDDAAVGAGDEHPAVEHVAEVDPVARHGDRAGFAAERDVGHDVEGGDIEDHELPVAGEVAATGDVGAIAGDGAGDGVLAGRHVGGAAEWAVGGGGPGIRGGDVTPMKCLAGAGMGAALSASGIGGLGILVGLGFYLPFNIVMTYSVGTALRFATDRFAGTSFADNTGIPIAAGFIVGEALVGVGFAVTAVVKGALV